MWAVNTSTTWETRTTDFATVALRWRELTPAEWRDADDRAIAELKATGTAQPREESFHCLFVDSPIECYGILDSTAAILLKTSSRSGGKALSRLFRSRQDIRRLSDRAQSIQND